jgi:hypothetical protein
MTTFTKMIELYSLKSISNNQFEQLINQLEEYVQSQTNLEENMLKMFTIVDDMLFHGLLSKTLKKHNISIRFSANTANTADSTGITRWQKSKKKLHVRVNTKLIADVIASTTSPKFAAGGRICTSISRCFVYTFLHELAHVFVILFRISSNKKDNWTEKSHGSLFLLISSNCFLQQAYKHGIIAGFRAYADCETVLRDVRNQKTVEFFDLDMWRKATLLSILNKYTARIRFVDESPDYEVPVMLLRPIK